VTSPGPIESYWNIPADTLINPLGGNRNGLAAATVAERSKNRPRAPSSADNGLRLTAPLPFIIRTRHSF
jgi:hypothetical protein